MFYVKASRREWVRCLALGALMLCGTCEAALPSLVRVGKSATKAIGPAILSDGLGAASCRWQVLGDPAGVDLADENTATCRVTGRAIGTYSLVLEVSDGERVARSRPVTVEVLNAGTVIVIR